MNKNDVVTYFITGGGTGGHIYPAVAVADFLATEDNNKIFYVGNPKNLEHDIVTKYPFLPVNISGMPRKVSFSFVIWTWDFIIAIITCVKYILKYKPNVVFGTGGYVSAPALIAAKLLTVPFVMHDCDSQPGLVTRMLSKYAQSVSLSFEAAKKFICNDNCYVNGNPIRLAFKNLTKQEARKNLNLQDKFTICIMGGSQGAKSINDATVSILKTLSQDYDVQVIFQTGKTKFAEVEEKLSVAYPDYSNDKNLLVKPYFDDMVSVLISSDIAVSRAGSLSISELCAAKIATVFVPYPHAAADHQRKNARIMENCGAGIYIEDDEINSDVLLKILSELVTDKEKMIAIQQNSANLAKYDSIYEIVKQIKKSI